MFLTVLLILIASFFICNQDNCTQDDENWKFPENFSFGAATSASQVEGAWNLSGKSQNIWDDLTHNTSWLIVDKSVGDVACDSYHKYKEDVKLLKNMGLTHYRFSISWSRILPTGLPNSINNEGLQYYKNLIDELLDNGIEPFVTLHHFDDLQSLYVKTGGWANESMIGYYEDYVTVVFRELGPKVKFWTTFNEISVFCTVFFQTRHSEAALVERYQCVHNMLKAHARAYHIYDKQFRPIQGGKIGYVESCASYYPKSKNDVDSAKVAYDFDVGWTIHPIFSRNGDYPESMKQKIAENSKAEGRSASRLPEFSSHWKNLIKGSSDYFGLNHYTSYMVETLPKIGGRWVNDSGILKSKDPAWPKTAFSEFVVVPKGMRTVLNKIKDEYGNPPVYILENGYSETDSTLFDTKRISFLYSYLKAVLLAIRDGCNVKAYTVWSLLDAFELYNGYSLNFGLVRVDFKDSNRKRTSKLSSYWLKAVATTKQLVPYNDTIISMIN